MPKETFNDNRFQSIGLHWGERNTQVSVRNDDTEVFASISVDEIDRLIKALRRAKRARSKSWQE